MGYQKKYEKHKQYDTQANKKLPATTTTASTLPVPKKKSSTTVEKKKQAPSKKKKKAPSSEKEETSRKTTAEGIEGMPSPPKKLLDADDNTVTTNDNYTGDESYLHHV